jgi:hypothetical protein
MPFPWYLICPFACTQKSLVSSGGPCGMFFSSLHFSVHECWVCWWWQGWDSFPYEKLKSLSVCPPVCLSYW